MALISPEASFNLIFVAIVVLFVLTVVTLLFWHLQRILQGRPGRRPHRQKIIDLESPRHSDLRGTIVRPPTPPIHKPLPQPPITPQTVHNAPRERRPANDEAQSEARGPPLDAALEGSRAFAEGIDGSEKSSSSGKRPRRLGFVPPPDIRPDIRQHPMFRNVGNTERSPTIAEEPFSEEPSNF